MNNYINEAKAGILKLINGPVEQVDLNISKFIQSLSRKHNLHSKFSFYSEEEQINDLKLPILLLDPIDGTREFRSNINECCISLSFLESYDLNNANNIHWIWNFFTDDEFLYFDSRFQKNKSSFKKFKKEKKLLTFISRSDYNLYQLESYNHKDIQIEPVGSIAYKLALMNADNCDFVISLTNKHIWDICAGSMLLSLNGSHFYQDDEKVIALNQRLLNGPMYWLKDENHQSLIQNLINDIQSRKR